MPHLTSTEVVHHLTATATDKGAPGVDPEYGSGEPDLVRALETDPATTTTTISDISRKLPPGLEAGMEQEAAAAEAAESADSGSETSTGLLVVTVAVVATLSTVLILKRRRI